MSLTGYGYLDDFLKEIRGQKAAGAKTAEPLSEPGGYQGKSTHPSADADDDLIEARTGSRASENTADVKDNREKPTVDGTPEVSAEGGEGTPKQDKQQLNIGTEQSSTGADPSVEDDYKGTKEDPGTSHPMKADDGEKYAQYKAMPFAKLAAHCIEMGNGLLADIATGNGVKTAGPIIQQAGAGATQRMPTPGQPAPPVVPGVSQQVKIAAEEGYRLASELGSNGDGRAAASALLEATVKEAAISADLVARWLAEVEKQAAGDDAGAGEDHSMPGDIASGAGDGGAPGGPPGGPPVAPGGPPPGPGGGPPGMPPGLEGALAGQPDPGMGAIDGNSPPGGGGPGGPGGPGGGGASPEQALAELASALMEMGIDPAQLAQVAQHLQAGAGGDQAKVAEAVNLHKAANAVASYRKSGKFGFAPAKTAQQEALRGHMRAYVAEALRLAS